MGKQLLENIRKEDYLGEADLQNAMR